jgi:hypothetical protein
MDLGELGPSKTKSASIEWRGYYQLPPLLVWAPALILLFFIRKNRNWRAATILIPALLANLIVLPFLFRLLNPLPGDNNYFLRFEANSFIAALTAFWLAMPLLSKIRWPLTVAFIFMFLLGLAAHICNYVTFVSFIYRYYLGFVLIFFLAMFTSGICCRKTYRPRRFLGWMLLWSILFAGFIGPALFILVRLISMAMQMPLIHFTYLARRFLDIDIFIRMIPNSIILYGAVVYLITVAFMYWVINSPYHYDCFRKILRLPEAQAVLPTEKIST